MRKVIPYIASQFRKDKIWLRRTKPSKRDYQICLAIDDSSSMVDNHSKQVRKSCCTPLNVWHKSYIFIQIASLGTCRWLELVSCGNYHLTINYDRNIHLNLIQLSTKSFFYEESLLLLYWLWLGSNCCVSCMVQLAFESLSVIVNALTLLEVGQVSVYR